MQSTLTAQTLIDEPLRYVQEFYMEKTKKNDDGSFDKKEVSCRYIYWRKHLCSWLIMLEQIRMDSRNMLKKSLDWKMKPQKQQPSKQATL